MSHVTECDFPELPELLVEGPRVTRIQLPISEQCRRKAGGVALTGCPSPFSQKMMKDSWHAFQVHEHPSLPPVGEKAQPRAGSDTICCWSHVLLEGYLGMFPSYQIQGHDTELIFPLLLKDTVEPTVAGTGPPEASVFRA